MVSLVNPPEAIFDPFLAVDLGSIKRVCLTGIWERRPRPRLLQKQPQTEKVDWTQLDQLKYNSESFARKEGKNIIKFSLETKLTFAVIFYIIFLI